MCNLRNSLDHAVGALLSLLMAIILTPVVHAQECALGWAAGPLAPDLSATDGPINVVIVYDPPGTPPPMLIVGGEFQHAGSVAANNIATWDGNVWRGIGTGTNGPVNALTVHNGNLIVGGNFTAADLLNADSRDVAAWNGTDWFHIGNGIGHPDPQFHDLEEVTHLAVFNGELIAAGTFLSAGGVSATRRTRLAGSTWTGIGEGGTIFYDRVHAVCVYDPPGTQPAALYMVARTVPTGQLSQLMKWNGTSWTVCPLLQGIQQVNDMTVSNVGLVLAGTFPDGNIDLTSSAFRGWNGTSGFAMGDDLNDTVSEDGMCVATYGGQLYGVRTFFNGTLDEDLRLVLWNGSTWTPLGGAFLGTKEIDPVNDMVQFGSDLMVAGDFNHTEPQTGEPIHNLAKWNGTEWWRLQMPVKVDALATLGSRLVLGGTFAHTYNQSTSLSAYFLATWNGLDTLPLEGGPVNGPVHALKSYSAFSTNYLIAGGEFTLAGSEGGIGGIAGVATPANRIAKWSSDFFNGGWSALGTGFNAPVLALEWLPANQFFGDVIFAGGEFTAAGSGSPAFNRIASWSGSPPQWFTMGTGFNNRVRALKGYNSGPIARFLYAGGDFTTASGVSANRIAYYPIPNQNGWVAMGSGFNGTVHAIELHNGSIYAGGEFTASGATPLGRVARWTGTAWVAVGSGFNGDVHALKSSGGFLYATGQFSDAQGVLRVARWDGTNWLPVPGTGGLDGPAGAIEPYKTELVFGGSFENAQPTTGSMISPGMARFRIQGLPWIVRQPVSQSVACGSNVNFHADIAAGYDDICEYQWFKNGAPIGIGWTGSGSFIFIATGDDDLQILDVSDADEGTYQLAISTSCGTITTASVTLEAIGTCPPCPEDISPPLVGDGVIGVGDLLAVISSWGACVNCPADMAPPGGNDLVNVADLLAVISHWGACP